MSIERFGDFLVRVSDGKITSDHVMHAFMMQQEFAEGYKKLGELLVENEIITEEELLDYLAKFEAEKNK